MDFVRIIAPADLFGIKLVAESNQFAIYAIGLETYLLVQRHDSLPWTGIEFSGDGLFRISGLLGEATRDLYREVAGKLSPSNREQPPFESGPITWAQTKSASATERRDLYEDDLTDERQISPVLRDGVAATLVLDPVDGDEHTGEPLTSGSSVKA
jgi:hypothetical protein